MLIPQIQTAVDRLVNTINEPTAVSVTVSRAYNGPVDVLFQNRQLTTAGGRLSDMIGAYGTVVYSLGQPPCPLVPGARVDPANILINPDFEEVNSAACLQIARGLR